MNHQICSVVGKCDREDRATEHHSEDRSIPRAETSPQPKDSDTFRAGDSTTHEKGMDVLRRAVEMSLHSEAIHKRSGNTLNSNHVMYYNSTRLCNPCTGLRRQREDSRRSELQCSGVTDSLTVFSLPHRALENEYLHFVSEVTQDILSRGVLSDSALTLLFRTHVEKNKGKLCEVHN